MTTNTKQGKSRMTRGHTGISSAVLAAVLGLAPSGSLHAQAAPAVAAPAAPTREELQAQQGSAGRAEPSRLTIEGGFERGSCALATPSLAAVRVTFSRVVFDGLPDIPAEDLDETWAGLTGAEQPLVALCEVRDRAAAMLRERGYLAAVQVPPQRIEKGGEVRMNVLAARLVDVAVRGEPGHAANQIAAHLRVLTKRRWFNVHEAERQLLLLRDLPGFDVRLTLRPANGAPGEVIGDVAVKRRPVEILVGGQNLGSHATGREGLVAQVTLNDLTGLGDRTVFSLFSTLRTREQTVASLRHDFALGADGLRVGGRLVYGRSRPDVAGGRFASETWIGALDLSYPFVRSQSLTLVGAAGLDAIDQSVDFAGVRLSRDKLRVGWARIAFDRVDGASLAGERGYSVAEPRLRLTGEVEVRKGLAAFGASRPCAPIVVCFAPNVPISNIAANPQGAVIRAEATIAARPTRAVTIALRPRAQYSVSQLLSFEQFTLGNYTVGRGYDPGVVQGDKGFAAALEVRFGGLMPRGRSALALQPYAFLDAGWAWSNDGATPMRHLVSSGAGVRARWGDHGDLDLSVAVPLERLPGQSTLGQARVLMTFSTRLLPWITQ